MATSRGGYAASILIVCLISAGLVAVSLAPAVLSQSTANVTIANYAFTPRTITVVIGVNNTVTWTNTQAGVTHTVTADDNSWGTTVNPGASYIHTFMTAGTFSYHCNIHPYMKGTVIVLPSASSSTTSSSAVSTSSPSIEATSTSSPTSTTTPATSVSTSSSSSSSGGIPEFPYGAAAVASITAIVLASYLLTRQSVRQRRTSP